MTTERPFAIGLLAGCIALAGCAFGSTASEERHDVGPVPLPSGPVVLTIDGDVDRPNDAESVRADLAGLEALGTESATIHEPFLSRDLDITGIPVAMLFAAAGIADDAETTWTALDDYQVRFVAGDLAAEDALLVTRIDGNEIAIEHGGPIRIVFPDTGGPIGRDSKQWIWSIDHIEVG